MTDNIFKDNLLEKAANAIKSDSDNDIIGWILNRDSHLVDYPRIELRPIENLYNFLCSSKQFWTSLLQETYSKTPSILSGALILKSTFQSSESEDYPRFLKIVFSFQNRIFFSELYFNPDFSLARIESLYEASGNFPSIGVVPKTNILSLYPESPLTYFQRS